MVLSMISRYTMMRQTKGETFLGFLEGGLVHGVCYGVNTDTGLYSFWVCDRFKFTALEEGLERSRAEFKIGILMGKGVWNDK